MSTEKPGAYAIIHRESGRAYVGATANLSKRWSRHRTDLRAGQHKSPRLQAAWDEFGADAFDWVILELCDRAVLQQREQAHIDARGVETCFNQVPAAGGNRGRVWPDAQRTEASLLWKRLRPPQAAGALCPHGHVKDGSYTRTGRSGTVRIICQECSRRRARERAQAIARG